MSGTGPRPTHGIADRGHLVEADEPVAALEHWDQEHRQLAGPVVRLQARVFGAVVQQDDALADALHLLEVPPGSLRGDRDPLAAAAARPLRQARSQRWARTIHTVLRSALVRGRRSHVDHSALRTICARWPPLSRRRDGWWWTPRFRAAAPRLPTTGGCSDNRDRCPRRRQNLLAAVVRDEHHCRPWIGRVHACALRRRRSNA